MDICVQASWLPSAPGADRRPAQSAQDTFQRAGPGYPTDLHSRSAVAEQPYWHRDSAGLPVSSSYSGGLLTASGASAVSSYPAGINLQRGLGSPFAISKDAMHSEERPADLVPQPSAAAGAPAHRHAAGRQNSKSEGAPFALAAEGYGRAVQSLPEPKSRETSPPYATHAQHRSADSSSKQAQARLLLGDSRQDNYARHGYQSLPVQEVRAASGANGLVRDEHESTGMSVDEGRAGSAGTLSPRHSISSLRPYANDASLQVCALDPSHLLVAPAGGTGI